MDTKVVNRGVNGEYNPWDTAPHFDRIFVRGLSEHSYGNGSRHRHGRRHPRPSAGRRSTGTPTHINSLTASTPAAIRTPVHFPTDRECLEKIWPTTGVLDAQKVTIGWIANSLEIGVMRVTENLRAQIESNPDLEIIGDAEEFDFDSAGNLAPLLASVAVTH